MVEETKITYLAERASILDKALIEARKNGFDLENFYYKYMIIQTHPDFPEFTIKDFSELLLLNKAENLLLFDRDFTKALFDRHVCTHCKKICKYKNVKLPAVNGLVPRGFGIVSKCCNAKVSSYGWTEYFQEMAFDENPLDTIKSFLKHISEG